jgi:hypothetical protein
MMDDAILHLFKYFPNHTIYVHNLGSFDSLYIIRSIYKLSLVKPLFKDNKLISIKATKLFDNKKINIIFHDSLLLFPLSLEKLIKTLSIPTQKLWFPYLFPNKNNLNYIGALPDFKYFNNISLNEYTKLENIYKNKVWNLQLETEKYVHNDVKALYEIIDIMSKTTYKLERLNITNVVSISSLALKTYLTNYYPINKQIQISKDKIESLLLNPKYEDYANLRHAYYGGRVELFKNYGENLYHYDVNSLFPYAMKKTMPGGHMWRSTDSNLDNYFGVCFVSVNVPQDTYNPILPFRDSHGNNYNPTGN